MMTDEKLLHKMASIRADLTELMQQVMCDPYLSPENKRQLIKDGFILMADFSFVEFAYSTRSSEGVPV